MDERGWDTLDILLVSGDAYIDHPSFGTALIGRYLESHGFRVGIIAQPAWNTPDDITRLGRPRLFCGISAGAMDSMVANYTAFRKKRRDDAFTPGGNAGSRPNRATIVYSNLVRRAFPGLSIVLGGIEASLRRAAHFDFWSNALRRSILFDTRADILVYGMGEKAILEIAEKIAAGENLEAIPGTCTLSNSPPGDVTELPAYEDIEADPKALMEATLAMEAQIHRGNGTLLQRHGNRVLVINPPAPPMTTDELDVLYELPFQRRAHPDYRESIPAADMIGHSITAMRGCAGGCTFCSLALHQGRRLRSRSAESIIREAHTLTQIPGWRGELSDVGGPTANLWGGHCRAHPDRCSRTSCLHPSRCPNLEVNQTSYLRLLNSLREIPGINSVRIGSGIRHDLALEDRVFCQGLIADYVGGQLKLAPEHSVDHVLALMRKTDYQLFERFCDIFSEESLKVGKKQYIVPYVLSAFPGCTSRDMASLGRWFSERGWRPQQVQCFIPTPGTVATAMFYGECDIQGNRIYVAKTDREREDQHRVLAQKGRPHKPGRQSSQRVPSPRRRSR